MPMLLLSDNEAMAWLQERDRTTLEELMRPASNDALRFAEVSSYVNKSSNEGPECIALLEDGQGLTGDLFSD